MSLYREVGLRELSEQDSSYLQDVLLKLGINAPFVGGFIAEHGQSAARGLILHQGSTWLLRTELIPVSASAVALQYFSKLNKAYPSDTLCKVEGSTILCARRFFRTPLFRKEHIRGLPEAEQSKLAKQVLQCVSKLHKHGLFHGHLSREDLFLESEAVKLADAGISFFSKVDAGKYGSLSDAIEAGVRLDHATLAELLEIVFDKISISASSSLIGKEGYLTDLEKQLSAIIAAAATVQTRDKPETRVPEVPQKPGAVVKPEKIREPEPSRPRRTEKKRGSSDKPRKIDISSSKPTPEKSDRAKQTRRKSERRKKDQKRVPQREATPGNVWLIPTLFLLILAGGLSYRYQEELYTLFMPVPEDTSLPFPELRSKWLSGNQASLIEVARYAVFSGDEKAQRVIVDSLVSDEPSARIFLKDPLVIAASSSWYAGLKATDRTALFAFTLAPLLRGELTQVPDLRSVHPGIALALLGGLPEGKDPTSLFRIVNEFEAKLPELHKNALVLLEEPTEAESALLFQSFLQIAFDRFSIAALNSYLPLELQVTELRRRIQAILPTLEEKEAELVWKHLQLSVVGATAVRWFQGNSLAKWEDLSSRQYLTVTFGKSLPLGLSIQQKADLLRAEFVDQKDLQLIPQLNSQIEQSGLTNFLRVLSHDSSLSRDLVISLVSSINVKGDATHVFLESWFATAPDPKVVVLLLASLSTSAPYDAFNIPAARYLRKNKKWAVTVDQLKLLADHPEPLARGLAYSRASLEDDQQRAILARRVNIETNKNLRKLLEGKLKPRTD